MRETDCLICFIVWALRSITLVELSYVYSTDIACEFTRVHAGNILQSAIKVM